MVSVKFQAKKRDCDEMFIPFFDDEKSGCDNWESDSAPCEERARLYSPGENGKIHDTGHQLPILENERSSLRQLQSKPLLSCHSKCTSIEGKQLPRWEKGRVLPLQEWIDRDFAYLSVRANKNDETSSANPKINKKLCRGGLGNELQLFLFCGNMKRKRMSSLNVEREVSTAHCYSPSGDVVRPLTRHLMKYEQKYRASLDDAYQISGQGKLPCS